MRIAGLKQNRYLTETLTWLMRLIVGGTFVFSGFVKAVDPWGTFYKFQEYIAAFGIGINSSLIISGVFALCAYEFLTGIFLIFGCYRKSAPVMAMLMMCVMLPLTLWIAIGDPVPDCGCFGDALIISNWATFWKNVVIILMVVYLLKFNTRSICLITPAFQWIAFVAGLAFILAIAFFGYLKQPLIDFRPYRTGTNLLPANALDSADEDNYTFIYEKDGEQKEFGIDDELPDEDSGWVFKERKQIKPENAAAPSDEGKTIRFWDLAGEEDLTDEAVSEEGDELILLMPDLTTVSPATTWKINSLYDWSRKNDIKMVGILSGSKEVIDEWIDLAMPQYPLYTGDDTAIKEVARGNPAVLFMRDGIVEWKSTLSSLDTEDFMDKNVTKDPMSFAFDSKGFLYNCVAIFLCVIAVLIMISCLPRIKRLFDKGAGLLRRHS